MVLPGAYAHRIVIKRCTVAGNDEALVVATGVEFSCGTEAEVHTVHAIKEVLLCAG